MFMLAQGKNTGASIWLGYTMYFGGNTGFSSSCAVAADEAIAAQSLTV